MIRFYSPLTNEQKDKVNNLANLIESCQDKFKQNHCMMVERETDDSFSCCAYGAAYATRENISLETLLTEHKDNILWDGLISSFGDYLLTGIKVNPGCEVTCMIKETLSIKGLAGISHYIVHMNDCEKLSFAQIATKLREIE